MNTYKFQIVVAMTLMVFSNFGSDAKADFVNGGFETGDLGGWQSLGTVVVETGGFGIVPPEGDFQALLSNHASGFLGVATGQVETFLGLSAGTLNSTGNGPVVQASVLQQTITANAGDIISFRWAFLTKEDPSSTSTNDFAFVSIQSAEIPSTLGNTFSTLSPSSSLFAFDTGYSTFSFEILSPGTFSIGFGVADVGDSDIASALLLDDVKLIPAAVPEPSSFLLGIFGILLIVIRRFTSSQ